MKPADLTFTIIPMTEEHGSIVCGWRYDPPYDVYNFRDWELLLSHDEEFANAAIREEQFRSVVNEQGELCGFVQLFPLVGITRLGLGMRPDLCGQGIGGLFMDVILGEARRKAPSNLIDLEVLAWNERAYKVYERAGFRYEQTYERMTSAGINTFHCMVYDSY